MGRLHFGAALQTLSAHTKNPQPCPPVTLFAVPICIAPSCRQLNRMHFELMLVLKIVVLHLVTEAVRHHTAKPCSGRFWFMVVGMTGVCLTDG
jgi:hypothetical protein